MNLSASAKMPAADETVHAARVVQLERRVDRDDSDVATTVGRCACGGGCPRCRAKVQAKIEISNPGDRYELEADQAADAILASSGREAARPVVSTITPLTLMRSGEGTVPASDSWHDSTAAQLDTSAARGSPLPATTLERMQRGFGADLSTVRVHADDGADRLNRDLGARAFTYGADVYFRAGEYRPGTASGDWLIAHEVAHVFQQASGGRHVIQRQLSGCAGLTANYNPATLVSGRAVHQAIEAHFLGSVAGATRVAIPGASAGPLRSQGICGEDDPVISPQQLGGSAGAGLPDLATIRPGSTVMQVAEIKPAAAPCLIDGEEQLMRYIDQGNARDPAQIAWRASLGIAVVSPMLESTYPAPQLLLPGVQITTAWCTPGLLAYSVNAMPPPIPVFDPAPERETERRTTRERTTEGTPVLVPAREPAWKKIAEWARRVYESGQNATEAADEFLRANPELVAIIIAAGAVAIVLLIADDATIAGIVDDVLIPIIAALEWVALRMQFGY